MSGTPHRDAGSRAPLGNAPANDGVVVPARGGARRAVTELPTALRPAFSHFQYFNAVQAEMLDQVLNTSSSFVVSTSPHHRSQILARPPRAYTPFSFHWSTRKPDLFFSPSRRRPRRQRQDHFAGARACARGDGNPASHVVRGRVLGRGGFGREKTQSALHLTQRGFGDTRKLAEPVRRSRRDVRNFAEFLFRQKRKLARL